MNPKWLLLAPPVVWSAVGLAALFAPPLLSKFFPVFWVMNDVSLMVALAGLFLLLIRSPGPTGPTVDEWSGWAANLDEDSPLEALLAELARRARLEGGWP